MCLRVQDSVTGDVLKLYAPKRFYKILQVSEERLTPRTKPVLALTSSYRPECIWTPGVVKSDRDDARALPLLNMDNGTIEKGIHVLITKDDVKKMSTAMATPPGEAWGRISMGYVRVVVPVYCYASDLVAAGSDNNRAIGSAGAVFREVELRQADYDAALAAGAKLIAAYRKKYFKK